jgi:hypothetical protein
MPLRPYPITIDLQKIGFVWRESFIVPTTTAENSIDLFNAPTIDYGIELDGVDQYAQANIQEGIIDQPELFIRFDFTPDWTIPPAAVMTVLDTGTPSRVLIYFDPNGNAYFYAGGTLVGRIAQADYQGVWNSQARNVVVMSATSGNNLIFLNGNKLTNDLGDAVVWTPSDPHDSFLIGRLGAAYFDGTIHDILIGSQVVLQEDGEMLSLPRQDEDSTYEIRPESSVITLPMNQEYVDGGLTVTSSLGQLGDAAQQPWLGVTGSDPANFPTILTPRGYNFDGVSELLTIPDNVLLSLGDGAGTDYPASICMLLRKNGTGVWTLLRKGGAGVTEYVIVGSGFQYFYILDSSSNYIGRRTAGLNDLDRPNIVSLVCTYSGSKTNAGIRIFVDAVRLDTADFSAGVYAGTGPFGGNLYLGGQGAQFYDGDVLLFEMYDVELTQHQVDIWDRRAKGLMQIR